MKNTPSPFSSPPPSPLLSPSPNRSGSSLNLNRSKPSSPEIDPSTFRLRERERVKCFVKNIRGTSSQLFKKDKKDGDSTPGKSPSTITSLVSETLSVSATPTTPNVLRRFSHSKQSSMTDVTAMESGSDLSASYLEVKAGEGGCIHSPILEIATPVSPAIVQSLDPVPISPLKETFNEVDARPENYFRTSRSTLFPASIIASPPSRSHRGSS